MKIENLSCPHCKLKNAVRILADGNLNIIYCKHCNAYLGIIDMDVKNDVYHLREDVEEIMNFLGKLK